MHSKIIQKKLSDWNAIFVIILLGILIYSNSFRNSFQFDDLPSIAHNSYIKHLANIRNIWDFWPTRFITYLSIAFNYNFAGQGVFSYHLFNLSVHLLATIFVWWLVKITLSLPVFKNDGITRCAPLIALFSSLIFLVHPLQTQAVTYIIQRATLLVTLFYLSALCFYIKARVEFSKGLAKRGNVYYSLCLFCAAAAMFTKEIAITFPLVVLLYEYYFLKDNQKLELRLILPVAAVALVMPATMALTNSVNFFELRLKSETAPGIPSLQYLLTQFQAVVVYLKLLVYPLHQNIDYDFPIAKSFFEIGVFSSFIFLTMILFAALRIFARFRLISFAILWFFITLMPESSIIPIKDVIVEHRLYLPMAGFALMLSSFFYYFLGYKNIKVMSIILILLICWFSFAAYTRNFDWKDPVTLWEDTVSKSPHKARPHNNLGFAYFQRKEYEKALREYNRALEIDPANAASYFNRGRYYLEMKEHELAMADFRKTIKIDSGFYDAYINIGNIYMASGRIDEALKLYEQSLSINPRSSEAYNNLGVLYGRKNDYHKAVSFFTRAIEYAPDNADCYVNLGGLFGVLGDYDKSIRYLTKAITLTPELPGAYGNLTVAYYYKKNYKSAVNCYLKAIDGGYVFNPEFSELIKPFMK